MKNKIGIFSWFGYELPFQARLSLIKQAGFDATFIWLGDEEQLVREGKKHLLPEFVNTLDLYLDSAHAPYQNCIHIWNENLIKRVKRVDAFKKDIDFCTKYSVPQLVMHITGSGIDFVPNEHGLKSIESIINHAKDCNITISIENARFPQFHDYVFERIKSPALKMCYDSGHDFIRSNNPTKILNDWGSSMSCTHFSDNDGVDDLHLTPGTGVINWEKIFRNFPNDYSGTIMLESKSSDLKNETPDLYLEKAYQAAVWLRDSLVSIKN